MSEQWYSPDWRDDDAHNRERWAEERMDWDDHVREWEQEEQDRLWERGA